MNEIERPGVDPIWLKNSRSVLRSRDKIRAMHGPNNVGELDFYARNGYMEMARKKGSPYLQPQAVTPAYFSWEAYLPSTLETYGLYLAWEFEPNSLAAKRFDTALAVRAFAAMYTAQIIDLGLYARSPRRFPGRTLHRMSFDKLEYTALGLVIGCREQALRLARMQLAGYRKGFYDADRDHYAGYHFILRILNDHLGGPPLALRGEALANPFYNALLQGWRAPDLSPLVPALLSVCDQHTRRYRGIPPHWLYREFSDFMRTPLEVLLLFKLREMHGLANPRLDHPLMNTPLGELPPEVNFEPDELIRRVRERMAQEGYDEEGLYAEVCGEIPAYAAKVAAAGPKGVNQSGLNPAAPAIPPWSPGPSGLRLREFGCPAFGLVLKAPEGFRDTSEGLDFGVLDPQNDIQFTASAYSVPVEYVEAWANLRFDAVASGMPFLRQVVSPYELHGQGWRGIAAEYQGTYPEEDFETRYLVLCLGNAGIWISLTLVASATAFAANEGLLRWLLANQVFLAPPGQHEKVPLGATPAQSASAASGVLDRIKGLLGRD